MITIKHIHNTIV